MADLSTFKRLMYEKIVASKALAMVRALSVHDAHACVPTTAKYAHIVSSPLHKGTWKLHQHEDCRTMDVNFQNEHTHQKCTTVFCRSHKQHRFGWSPHRFRYLSCIRHEWIHNTKSGSDSTPLIDPRHRHGHVAPSLQASMGAYRQCTMSFVPMSLSDTAPRLHRFRKRLYERIYETHSAEPLIDSDLHSS